VFTIGVPWSALQSPEPGEGEDSKTGVNLIEHAIAPARPSPACRAG